MINRIEELQKMPEENSNTGPLYEVPVASPLATQTVSNEGRTELCEEEKATSNVIKACEIEVVSPESPVGSMVDEPTSTQLPQKSSASSNEVPLGANEAIRPELTKVAKKIIKGMPHTRGDMDAKVGRTTNYTWFCGYLMGFVVDDANQIITAVTLGAGNSKQAALFEPAITAHINRVGVPESVAADSAFDDHPTHTFLDNRGIVGHITSRNHSKPKDGGYGTDRVTWKDG